MGRRKAVITGIGIVSPVGNNKEAFWDALISGKSGIHRITRFDATNYEVQIAGEVKEFHPEERLDRKEIKRYDIFTQYALYSADEAIKDASLNLDKEDMEKIGVIIASGIGGSITWEEQHSRLMTMGPERVSPLFIPKMIINTAPGSIAIRYGFKGPNFATVSACASSGHAIGEALRKIQYGDMDIAITGGTEGSITPLAVSGFTAMKALSRRNDAPEKSSRPFDKDRDGFVMAEGAGILVLEELEHAKNRGAKIYAELCGYGATDDAFHITAPDETADGPTRAMRIAIQDAGMNIEEVEYINAHGTSTILNDKIETRAIKNLFEEYAYKIPVSSTKSMTGHTLGAAAGLEAIACIKSIETGIIHPTINLITPDPECDLNYTPNKAVQREVNVALSNSLGFGGHNGTIIFKKYIK